ncbi:mechanosensitive ion channel family protein [Selenomonas sp. oral taxon 149]|uniref:mechanosensitive ion channel family protein n=1 Tax=Selenomonas sp. oral taxon 149 TaxID=712535 RepID=UPI0001E087E5|nr:mechanosensitive ion channel family protein [Selenomonas sp. oral taxon 149]EFM22357.1 transporter, small conductance mechanosensitive ion channel MscS family protein [Selenomonas sp. oral taxon 149 str. 67H29BP]
MFTSLQSLDVKALVELLLVPTCIVLGALTVGIITDRLIRRYINHHLAVDESTWKYVFIRSMHGVPIFFSFIIGLYWAIDAVEISPTLTKMLSYLLFTSNVITITRVFARTVDGVVTMYFERSNKDLPKTTLLNNILIGVIYVMGVLVILQYYGISIAPILTAAGVGGMAVALALQETLANIFAGLHLILSKQIRIGDYIRLGTGEEGRVTDIAWRFTTIVPVGASNTVVIPNKTIAGANITNFSLPTRSLNISVPVGVAYDSDLALVERVTIETAKEVLARVDNNPNAEPLVRYTKFNDSSIDFAVILPSSQFDQQGLIIHDFIKALTDRYRIEGIDIPYPIRTVIQEQEDAPAETPAPTKAQNA